MVKCGKDLVGMDLHVPEDTKIIDWDAALDQVRYVDYKIPLWDVVGMKSRGCHKLKRGNTEHRRSGV